jgi:hypothetical protein
VRQAWRHASCHSMGRVCRAHAIVARRRAFHVVQLAWIDIIRYNYSRSGSSWSSTPIFDPQLRWLGNNCFIYSPCPFSDKSVFSIVSTQFQSTTPSIPILRTFKGSHHIPIQDQVAKPEMQPSARISWGDLIAPTKDAIADLLSTTTHLTRPPKSHHTSSSPSNMLTSQSRTSVFNTHHRVACSSG